MISLAAPACEPGLPFESERFVPPRPAVPKDVPRWHWPHDLLRLDPLAVWPEAAYDRDHYTRRFLGIKRLLLNSPDAIRHVLMDSYANYRRAPGAARVLRPLAGNGLLLSEGEEWKHQRRTIAPALNTRNMPVLAAHAVSTARELVAELARQQQQPIDLLSVMQRVALEIAGRSMFSLEIGEHGPALRTYVARFSKDLGRPSLIDMIAPPSVSAPRDRARRLFQADWMGLIERIVESRFRDQDRTSAGPRDLFDILLAARDPETGRRFSRTQLRDQVATMIAAGHETTGTTLFWSFYLLACAPWAQDRVAAEAGAVEISESSVSEALAKLQYTRAVVSETLRLYPPAYTISRQAIRDDAVGSLAIRAGMQVIVMPWVLHRHRRYWHDPDRFSPTRFGPGSPAPDRFTYLPFGIGPRVCVGASFAMAETTLILGMIVRNFRIELCEPACIFPVARLTLQPDHPGQFRFVQRGS
jgi:cytochrome P450